MDVAPLHGGGEGSVAPLEQVLAEVLKKEFGRLQENLLQEHRKELQSLVGELRGISLGLCTGGGQHFTFGTGSTACTDAKVEDVDDPVIDPTSSIDSSRVHVANCRIDVSEWEPHEPTSPVLMSRGMTRMDQTIQTEFSKVSIQTSPEEYGACRQRAFKLMHNGKVEILIVMMIMLNALVIGIQAEYLAQGASTETLDLMFNVLELFFVMFFVLELLLRMIADGVGYFTRPGAGWNVFDAILCVVMLVDTVGMLVGSSVFGIEDSGLLRLHRTLRILRVARMVRLLRFVPELKFIVSLIGASFGSFFWAAALMMIMMYCLALYFTIIATQIADQSAVGNRDIRQVWGSVGISLQSLFMAVAGGEDWHKLLLVFGFGTPLYIVNSAILSIFVGFFVLVMLNLVMGVLVEGAQTLITARKEADLVRMAARLFAASGKNAESELTTEEFRSFTASGVMDTYCEEVGMTVDEADSLFLFLDRDDSGSVSIAEFVQGCLRLRGPAKALDLAELRLWAKSKDEDNKARIKALHTLTSDLKRSLARTRLCSFVPMSPPKQEPVHTNTETITVWQSLRDAGDVQDMSQAQAPYRGNERCTSDFCVRV